MNSDRDFVIAEMQGDLGDWIFGYMFAYVWAHEHNITNIYAKPEMQSFYKQIKYYNQLKNSVFRNINFILNTPTNINKYYPNSFYQVEDFSWIEPKNGILFGGAVQYYPLYKNYRKDFIKIFGPSNDIKKEIYTLYGDLTEYVGFNIKRENFFNHSTFGGYNENEIDYILKTYCQNKKVIITSDDIEWCKKNIFHPDIIFADSISEKYNKTAIDFYINMLCGENIISAGSSFSWLSAWMNEIHGGECNKVYTPELWINDSIPLQEYSECMILEPWTKIKLKIE